jgi:hypothetical protein
VTFGTLYFVLPSKYQSADFIIIIIREAFKFDLGLFTSHVFITRMRKGGNEMSREEFEHGISQIRDRIFT